MKAILVLDEMPKSCSECDMLDSTVSYGYTWVHVCRLNWKEHTGKGRPSWCPLKEMPKRKGLFAEMHEYDTDIHYEIGWNACLEEIEK